MSIVTYPLNGITYDADDVQTYLCTRTSGVYSSEDCFDISITDDMEVTIGPGIAWIKNADFAGKSICMDESSSFTISLSSGTYGRIDRIILKFDTEANETTLEVLEGTSSSSPEGADIEQDETIYELCLYEISVPAGTTELSASLITDTRADEDLCGLMRDGVTTIPTATLQAAASELLEKLKADLEGVEDGSAFMMATVYDEKGGAKQVAFEDDIGDLIDEYLPFSLAISDGDYGYYDTNGEFHPFRNPTGDAEASDVLSGKIFSNADEEDVTGTMTNRGNVTATLNCGSSYTIPNGYHAGGGKVTANSLSSQTSANAAAAQILNGYTAWVNGSKVTGNMTNRGNVTQALNCGTSYTIPSGYHGGGGTITANSLASQTSANATAAQILNTYTAWVNGAKITGSMNNWGSNTVTLTTSNTATRSAGYYSSISVNAAGLYSNAYSAGNTAGYNTGYTEGNSTGYSAAMVGNATAARVLNGYTFTNASSVGASGTMNNWGSNSVSMSSNTANLSAGYYSSISINAAARYTAGYNAGYNAKSLQRVSVGNLSNVSSGTLNCKSISGYANLTANNFAVCVTGLTATGAATNLNGASYPQFGSVSASGNISKSYNASNGVLTVSGLGVSNTYTNSDSTWRRTVSAYAAVQVWCYYAS